jgi:hypothetical protein
MNSMCKLEISSAYQKFENKYMIAESKIQKADVAKDIK